MGSQKTFQIPNFRLDENKIFVGKVTASQDEIQKSSSHPNSLTCALSNEHPMKSHACTKRERKKSQMNQEREKPKITKLENLWNDEEKISVT
jgi:hypothetical protein